MYGSGSLLTELACMDLGALHARIWELALGACMDSGPVWKHRCGEGLFGSTHCTMVLKHNG